MDYLSTGEVVFSDAYNMMIKKIHLNGTVEVIAQGPTRYNGEGKVATISLISTVEGLTFHPITGELWIADSNNHRVRRIKSDGTMETMVGNGDNSMTNGPALTSALRSPAKLAFKSNGDLYIVANDGQELRFYNDSSVQLSTITSSIPYQRGEDITTDSNGNAILMLRNGMGYNVTNASVIFNTNEFQTKGIHYVDDSTFYTIGGTGGFIRKCVNGNCTIIAGYGTDTSDNIPLSSAKLGYLASSIVVLPNGDFYMNNGDYQCGIRKYSNNTGLITYLLCIQGCS